MAKKSSKIRVKKKAVRAKRQPARRPASKPAKKSVKKLVKKTASSNKPKAPKKGQAFKTDTFVLRPQQEEKALPKTTQEQITQLFKKAKKQGFVTQEEILDVFVEPELYLEQLDDFYDRITVAHIDVFEAVSEVKEEELDDELQQELEILTSLKSTGVADPVRMYLKEIGYPSGGR